MRRTGRGGARRALALAAVALAACLCAGAAFAAGGDRGESGFASDVNDVPALAAGREAGQQGGQDAPGDAGDGSDQAGSGLQLSKTAVYNEDTDDYTVTLEAYATGSSTTTVVKDGADIVLMLDLSDYMYGTTYESVSGDTTLEDLYARQQSGTVYYVKNDGVYQKVTVSQRQVQQGGGRPGPGSTPTYTYAYSVRNGVTGDSLATDRPSGTTLTYAGLSLFSASTDKGNPAKLTALKTAVNGFIGEVHDEAPASRIAIVTYADEAVVESGLRSVADEALVTVDDSGRAVLEEIVDGLTVRGGASNSHYAAADAVKIFQDVPADSPEYKRPRFALLFSAGVSGTGWATTEDGKDLLTSGQSVAWATMSQALVLKTERGQTAQVPANQNMDGGAYWGSSYSQDFKGTDIYENTVYAGCGATVYCVGLDIQTSGDCSRVDMHDEPFKSGALANEYFWRTSSDRPNGTHITRPSDLGSNGQSTYDNRLSGTTYSSYYYFYPDSLTRNQGSGHYMTTTSGSASDLAKLNDIFAEIASSVVTGVTTSTTLGSEAVVKDVVAPQFTVPTNASDVKVYTAECKNVSSSGALAFGEPTAATGVTATISGSTLSVTGFDFSDNWCGPRTDANGETTYDGEKLIIKFNVKARGGFLGGNDVYTNASAGVYENSTATEPVQEFPKPKVNVPIGAVTATAPEKNVYLLGSLTAEQIKSGAKVACGDVELDPSKADQNYGLDSWQTEYVVIEVSYTDASGDAVANLSSLKDDTTYTVTATVSPKTETPTSTQGTVAIAKTGSATGNINVFKPELTFKDSEVWYGGDAPTDYSGNKTSEAWKHGTTPASPDAMIGMAPTLNLTYASGSGKISADGKIASKDDVAVDVTVKIGTTDVTGSTAFVHTKCDASCTNPSAGKFWLHVKTCSLTVKKAFDTGSAPEPGETFLFAVSGGDVPVDVEVTLCADAQGAVAPVTVSGLPVGSYAVTENGNWSWRYDQTTAAGLTNGKIALSSQAPNGEVTFTNKKTNDNWLDFSGWCRNLFKGSGVYDGVGVGQVTGGATRPAAQAS